MSVVPGMSPFLKEYYESQLAKFKVLPAKYKNIEIKRVDVQGRIDGYMYKHFGEIKDVPVLTIDGKTWMSITPMEVESHYMPILLAKGKVGVAGLGLGYYVQNILDKPEASEVIVYEINQDIVDLYLNHFGSHPKLTLKVEDFKQMKGMEFDFFYCDIYPQALMTEAIDDMCNFWENDNYAKVYHFWTFEAVIWEMLNAKYTKEIPHEWRDRYIPFLQDLVHEKEGLAQVFGLGRRFHSKFKDLGMLDW